MSAKRQLEFSIDEDEFITSKLSDIQKRIERYTQEIGPINDSSESKAKSHNTLLEYASIVEKISDLKQKHAEVDLIISLNKKEIADLEKGKVSKQPIIVVQPPTASQHPIKPNKMRNVMLATIVGLFMMVFLSFLIEYITQNRKKRSFTKACD